MRRSPPPIRLLPAFEASARLQSFKAAAKELNVTPSAVSQQIKSLEELMDTQLFTRQPGGVALTPVGQGLYHLAAEMLQNYRQGFDQLQQQHTEPVIRISTMAQIAYETLIPALPRFQDEHPEIDVRIETSETLVEFDSDWINAAVRIGIGQWPGLRSELLCPLRAAAFVSPQLVDDNKLRTFADIPQLTLIHSRTHIDDWEAVGTTFNLDLRNNKHLYFENYFSAVAAAESGLGVALGLLPLSQRKIDEGRLVKLMDIELPLEASCHLVYPPRQENNPSFLAAADWLREVFRKWN